MKFHFLCAFFAIVCAAESASTNNQHGSYDRDKRSSRHTRSKPDLHIPDIQIQFTMNDETDFSPSHKLNTFKDAGSILNDPKYRHKQHQQQHQPHQRQQQSNNRINRATTEIFHTDVVAGKAFSDQGLLTLGEDKGNGMNAFMIHENYRSDLNIEKIAKTLKHYDKKEGKVITIEGPRKETDTRNPIYWYYVDRYLAANSPPLDKHNVAAAPRDKTLDNSVFSYYANKHARKGDVKATMSTSKDSMAIQGADFDTIVKRYEKRLSGHIIKPQKKPPKLTAPKFTLPNSVPLATHNFTADDDEEITNEFLQHSVQPSLTVPLIMKSITNTSTNTTQVTNNVSSTDSSSEDTAGQFNSQSTSPKSRSSSDPKNSENAMQRNNENSQLPTTTIFHSGQVTEVTDQKQVTDIINEKVDDTIVMESTHNMTIIIPNHDPNSKSEDTITFDEDAHVTSHNITGDETVLVTTLNTKTYVDVYDAHDGSDEQIDYENGFLVETTTTILDPSADYLQLMIEDFTGNSSDVVIIDRTTTGTNNFYDVENHSHRNIVVYDNDGDTIIDVYE